MILEKIKTPFNFIIFGASGDLAKLKIFPSIYELALQKRFPKQYRIYGYARTPMSNKQFRAHFKRNVKANVDKLIYNEVILNELLDHVFYQQGQYDQKKDFEAFSQKLREEKWSQKATHLAFFAIPPIAFKPIVKHLAGIQKEIGGDLKLMLEKPFGNDLKSAKALFKFVRTYFEKEDLFLIDHYLGKAAVRSIFPLRYNNAILNLLLKGEVISNIQITAMEKAGVDERIGFFEEVGIIKDMVQSHLLQILALLTMSLPVHQAPHSIQREKVDVIASLRLDNQKDIVLGQYKSYKAQKGVKKSSRTPTFAAMRCFIDSSEWYDVPIYIRAGKKLSHKHTYVVVEFKKPPYIDKNLESNKLIIELYPKEKIQIKLINDIGKEVPQYSELISEESLACHGDDCLPPYASLILDALLERRNSFLTIDEILASWHFIDEVNTCIKKKKVQMNQYKKDSEGPLQQSQLTEMDHNTWYDAKHL